MPATAQSSGLSVVIESTINEMNNEVCTMEGVIITMVATKFLSIGGIIVAQKSNKAM